MALFGAEDDVKNVFGQHALTLSPMLTTGSNAAQTRGSHVAADSLVRLQPGAAICHEQRLSYMQGGFPRHVLFLGIKRLAAGARKGSTGEYVMI